MRFPCFAKGVTEIGCMAHARRKFVDLHVAGKSQIAEQAVDYIGQLYQVGREAQTLTRHLDDGGLPIDNNRVENPIRPCALGRSNSLFAGSLRSDQRAANIMSLIQCAKLNK